MASMPVDKEVSAVEHYNFGRIFELANFAQSLEAGHVRHHDVEQDHVNV